MMERGKDGIRVGVNNTEAIAARHFLLGIGGAGALRRGFGAHRVFSFSVVYP